MQLYLGALVAGLRAGLVYNTWPDIDGGLVPAAARLFFEAPWWRNLFDNTLTVQFEHRMTAYVLFALAVLHAVDALRSRAGVAAIRGALWLAAAITLQATLGVLTLLHHVPIDLALTHQAVAIAVLTLAMIQVERLAVRQSEPQPPRQCRSPRPVDFASPLSFRDAPSWRRPGIDNRQNSRGAMCIQWFSKSAMVVIDSGSRQRGVRRGPSVLSLTSRNTGSPAFAGDDSSVWLPVRQKLSRALRQARWRAFTGCFQRRG